MKNYTSVQTFFVAENYPIYLLYQVTLVILTDLTLIDTQPRMAAYSIPPTSKQVENKQQHLLLKTGFFYVKYQNTATTIFIFLS